MQKFFTQMPLSDIYDDVALAMEEDKASFLQMLEDHINLDRFIPREFKRAYYANRGRPHKHHLESMLWFCILQKVIGIPTDTALLAILQFSRELRDFCGFQKVPDASQISRFRQVFAKHIKAMFDALVDSTEPICRMIDEKKADYLIYDTTGIEANVAENNPKFMNAKLAQAKKLAKANPGMNPYALAYSLMPGESQTNPFAKQQYINGHFCYAFKAGILCNGLGIVRDIAFFDEGFKLRHPEVVTPKTDNPDSDKELGDSTSLKPVLSDFFKVHPDLSYRTFLGDSAFDTYDAYSMLRGDFKFDRICVPINKRNSSGKHADFDSDGTPLCPRDGTPFTFLGASGGRGRSKRFKYVCHMSHAIRGSSKRSCSCENPCTESAYGRCVYTYPDANLRLYPGMPRGTAHWANLYRHRVLVERCINTFKDPLGVAWRRSYSAATAKADLLLAGITQLIGVVLAHALKRPDLYKSIRRLIA